ncbi:MAG: FG-GAP repeat protein, partial [Ktedonobacteraceae bacterium]
KGIVVGDVNGDGYPDIVTLNYLSRNVTVLLANAFTSTPTRITMRSPAPQPSPTPTRKPKHQSHIGNNPPTSPPSDIGARRQKICGGRWWHRSLCGCHFLCRPHFRFLRNKNDTYISKNRGKFR